MRILSRIISWLTYDGVLHFVVCLALMDILRAFFAIWIALIVVLGLALWREFSDLKRKGHFEWHDLWCDLLGIALATVLQVYSTFVSPLP